MVVGGSAVKAACNNLLVAIRAAATERLGFPNEQIEISNAMVRAGEKQVALAEFAGMVRPWAQRDYGNRVGVFRMMEVLSKHYIRGSAALNSDICDYHPEIIEDAVKLGWEFLGHNKTNTTRLNAVPAEEEHELILADRTKKATGRGPVGWLGSGLTKPGTRSTTSWRKAAFTSPTGSTTTSPT